MTTWRQIAEGMPEEARRELLAALLGHEERTPLALLDQRLVATPGDVTEREFVVPQWTGADGTLYGVVIRALTFRDRMLAEREATVTDPKTGRTEVDPWRLMAEEVAAGIVRPKVKVDHVLDWNDSVVRSLYAAIHELAPYPPARVAAELVTRAGGPAPEPRRSGGDAPAVQPSRARSRTPQRAPEQPRPADDGGTEQ